MLATQWAKGIHKRQIWHQLNRGLPWAIKERQVWVQRKSLKLGPLICLAQKLQASTHKLNIHFIDIRKKIWWVEPDWLLGSSEWISHRDTQVEWRRLYYRPYRTFRLYKSHQQPPWLTEVGELWIPSQYALLLFSDLPFRNRPDRRERPWAMTSMWWSCRVSGLGWLRTVTDFAYENTSGPTF